MAVFFNDQYLDTEDALLKGTDLSIQRGYAIFDFLRTVHAQPLFLHDYLDRFFHSAAAMHLSLDKTKEELIAITYELLKQSAHREAGIRFLLTGGYSPDSFSPGTPNLIITCKKLIPVSAEKFEKGISIITYDHQRELPHIKTTNYLMAVWLQPLLKEKQAEDVLYYHNNYLTEFPRGNLFIVTKEGTLVTPAHNILHGITRKNIINLAKDFLRVEERDITSGELVQAGEAFYTSTTKRILPVIKVDNKIIGTGKPGKITRDLYQRFLLREQSSVISV